MFTTYLAHFYPQVYEINCITNLLTQRKYVGWFAVNFIDLSNAFLQDVLFITWWRHHTNAFFIDTSPE